MSQPEDNPSIVSEDSHVQETHDSRIDTARTLDSSRHTSTIAVPVGASPSNETVQATSEDCNINSIVTRLLTVIQQTQQQDASSTPEENAGKSSSPIIQASDLKVLANLLKLISDSATARTETTAAAPDRDLKEGSTISFHLSGDGEEKTSGPSTGVLVAEQSKTLQMVSNNILTENKSSSSFHSSSADQVHGQDSARNAAHPVTTGRATQCTEPLNQHKTRVVSRTAMLETQIRDTALDAGDVNDDAAMIAYLMNSSERTKKTIGEAVLISNLLRHPDGSDDGAFIERYLRSSERTRKAIAEAAIAASLMKGNSSTDNGGASLVAQLLRKWETNEEDEEFLEPADSGVAPQWTRGKIEPRSHEPRLDAPYQAAIDGKPQALLGYSNKEGASSMGSFVAKMGNVPEVRTAVAVPDYLPVDICRNGREGVHFFNNTPQPCTEDSLNVKPTTPSHVNHHGMFPTNGIANSRNRTFEEYGHVAPLLPKARPHIGDVPDELNGRLPTSNFAMKSVTNECVGNEKEKGMPGQSFLALKNFTQDKEEESAVANYMKSLDYGRKTKESSQILPTKQVMEASLAASPAKQRIMETSAGRFDSLVLPMGSDSTCCDELKGLEALRSCGSTFLGPQLSSLFSIPDRLPFDSSSDLDKDYMLRFLQSQSFDDIPLSRQSLGRHPSVSEVALGISSTFSGRTDWLELHEKQLPPLHKSNKSLNIIEEPEFTPAEEAAQALASLQPDDDSGSMYKDDGSGEESSDESKLKKNKPRRARQSYEPEQKVYVHVNDRDVLLGRGGRTNNHPGNKKYLQIKDEVQVRYLKADKNEKTAISQELVDIVHNWGGRFLKLDDGTEDKWFEVPNIIARKKASQSLREINTADVRAAKRRRYAK